MTGGTVLSWQGLKRTLGAGVMQRGMYLRMHPEYSVVFCCFSGGRYSDRELADGTILYCGHNMPGKTVMAAHLDQPLVSKGGKLTQNALFLKAAQETQTGTREAEPVRVFEKMAVGMWRDRGFFRLMGYREEEEDERKVYRFILMPEVNIPLFAQSSSSSRQIPARIRALVWERDGGRCQECGSTQNLVFDHIIPVALGGASTASNVQILCASCNAAKSATIGWSK